MKLEDITSATTAIVLEGHRFHKLNKKHKVYNPAYIVGNESRLFDIAKVIDSGTSEANGDTPIAFGYDWDVLMADLEDMDAVANDQWDSLTSSKTFDWFVLQEPKSDWYRWIVIVPEDWK